MNDRPPPAAHLVGIAGSGMQSLAKFLLESGWRVTGSDLNVNDVVPPLLAKLRDQPLPQSLFPGHSPDYLPPTADVLVHSLAIGPENCERLAAAERRMPTYSYPAMAARLLSDRSVLAIAGTHGKSTTVAMLREIFAAARLTPAVLAGGTTLDGQPLGQFGREWGIVEACEFRRSFLAYAPRHAAILNLELDHVDCYPNEGELHLAFSEFAARIAPGGRIFASEAAAQIVRESVDSGRLETLGESADCNWRAVRITKDAGRYRFGIRRHGTELGEVQLGVPGRHQVHCALAAAALAAQAGISAEAISEGLGSYSGLARRLEVIGSRAGVTCIDDYAHHPSEVTATLDTVREMNPGRRLCVVFEPHQAGRLARFCGEFARSLQAADRLWIAPVFRAREAPQAPGDSSARDLARRCADRGTVVLDGQGWPEIITQVQATLFPGDVLVTLGAGEVRKRFYAAGFGAQVVAQPAAETCQTLGRNEHAHTQRF